MHVSDKDLFKEQYQGHLSARLLQGKTVSDDAEKFMLTLMKGSQGTSFTMQLDSMITDYRAKDEAMEGYPEQWLEEGAACLSAADDGTGRMTQVAVEGGRPFEF